MFFKTTDILCTVFRFWNESGDFFWNSSNFILLLFALSFYLGVNTFCTTVTFWTCISWIELYLGTKVNIYFLVFCVVSCLLSCYKLLYLRWFIVRLVLWESLVSFLLEYFPILPNVSHLECIFREKVRKRNNKKSSVDCLYSGEFIYSPVCVAR